jgi:16S rRNA processing protein RimM
LKGEVRVEILLDEERVFEPGTAVFIKVDAKVFEAEIEFLRRQHGRSVLKFRGIDSIDDVEKYIGALVQIDGSKLPPANEGSFYTFQLKGCRVFTADGEYIGNVTDVIDSGGTDILKVDDSQGETLIPFAEAYLKKIDLAERRIEVELPEGLLGLNR